VHVCQWEYVAHGLHSGHRERALTVCLTNIRNFLINYIFNISRRNDFLYFIVHFTECIIICILLCVYFCILLREFNLYFIMCVFLDFTSCI
jgi:hypothetical protein